MVATYVTYITGSRLRLPALRLQCPARLCHAFYADTHVFYVTSYRLFTAVTDTRFTIWFVLPVYWLPPGLHYGCYGSLPAVHTTAVVYTRLRSPRSTHARLRTTVYAHTTRFWLPVYILPLPRARYTLPVLPAGSHTCGCHTWLRVHFTVAIWVTHATCGLLPVTDTRMTAVAIYLVYLLRLRGSCGSHAVRLPHTVAQFTTVYTTTVGSGCALPLVTDSAAVYYRILPWILTHYWLDYRTFCHLSALYTLRLPRYRTLRSRSAGYTLFTGCSHYPVAVYHTRAYHAYHITAVTPYTFTPCPVVPVVTTRLVGCCLPCGFAVTFTLPVTAFCYRHTAHAYVYGCYLPFWLDSVLRSHILRFYRTFFVTFTTGCRIAVGFPGLDCPAVLRLFTYVLPVVGYVTGSFTGWFTVTGCGYHAGCWLRTVVPFARSVTILPLRLGWFWFVYAHTVYILRRTLRFLHGLRTVTTRLPFGYLRCALFCVTGCSSSRLHTAVTARTALHFCRFTVTTLHAYPFRFYTRYGWLFGLRVHIRSLPIAGCATARSCARSPFSSRLHYALYGSTHTHRTAVTALHRFRLPHVHGSHGLVHAAHILRRAALYAVTLIRTHTLRYTVYGYHTRTHIHRIRCRGWLPAVYHTFTFYTPLRRVLPVVTLHCGYLPFVALPHHPPLRTFPVTHARLVYVYRILPQFGLVGCPDYGCTLVGLVYTFTGCWFVCRTFRLVGLPVCGLRGLHYLLRLHTAVTAAHIPVYVYRILRLVTGSFWFGSSGYVAAVTRCTMRLCYPTPHRSCVPLVPHRSGCAVYRAFAFGSAHPRWFPATHNLRGCLRFALLPLSFGSRFCCAV